jgi:hypothetical protein
VVALADLLTTPADLLDLARAAWQPAHTEGSRVAFARPVDEAVFDLDIDVSPEQLDDVDRLFLGEL